MALAFRQKSLKSFQLLSRRSAAERMKQLKKMVKLPNRTVDEPERFLGLDQPASRRWVDLTRGDLTRIDSTRVDLTKVDLTRVGLARVDLTRVNLTRVGLTRVDLTRIDLTRVDLTRVDLTRVDLTRVDLPRVDLSWVNSMKIDLTRDDCREWNSFLPLMHALTRMPVDGGR